MPSRALVALALLVALSGACTTETPVGHAAPAAPAEQPAPSAEAPASNPACDAETKKLQRGLDAAHERDTAAVLAVKTPTCGVRVLTSGARAPAPTALHRIGSVTKTYVGAVVIRLAGEGKLSLDDAIATFDLGVPNGEKITISHLLHHTSGLFNYTDDETLLGEALTQGKSFTPAALVAVAVSHDPYFEPGASWRYSNTNFILLGMIAEKVSGSKIGALVRARVLDEVGLRSTFFEGEEPLGGELAPGFSKTGEELTNAYGPTWSWSAGAMVASPADVVTWAEALGSGSYYGSETQKTVLETVPTGDGATSYGLAVMVFDAKITGGMGRGIGHGGDIPGYHTQAFHFPEKKTTIVAIVDSDAASPNDVTVAALEVLAPK